MTGTQDSKKFDYQMSYNFKEKQKVLKTTFCLVLSYCCEYCHKACHGQQFVFQQNVVSLRTGSQTKVHSVVIYSRQAKPHEPHLPHAKEGGWVGSKLFHETVVKSNATISTKDTQNIL